MLGGIANSESSALFDDLNETSGTNQPSRAQKIKNAREHRQKQLKHYYEIVKEEKKSGPTARPRQSGGRRHVNFDLSVKLQDAVLRFDTKEGKKGFQLG